jgi:pilus assembly protein CpaE
MGKREIRIFLIVDDQVDYDSVRAALPAGAPVRVSSLGDAAGRMPALLAEAPVDVVVLGCADYSERALRTIESSTAERPDAPVLVLYAGSPNGFMEAVFEAGAADLITLPQGAGDVAFALDKVLARRRGSATGGAESPMITVLGPKGGTGKTLTACNLAVALAAEQRQTVVVDLDLQFGDVGLALGLKPVQTIYDLATSVGSLDADKVDSFLSAHESGARALLAPIRPDQAAAIKIPFLQELFALLRSRYDFVIVDTPPAFSPEVIAAIDVSSHLCVVGMLDALSLKNTKIGFETLEKMGYATGETTLVLNRADTNVGITAADVADILGRAPDILVPSDVAIPRAITAGQPIVVAAPRSGAAKAYVALAQSYASATTKAEVRAEVAVKGIELSPRRRRMMLKKGR